MSQYEQGFKCSRIEKEKNMNKSVRKALAVHLWVNKKSSEEKLRESISAYMRR